MEDHVKYVSQMSERYGISKVFIASDDEDAASFVAEKLPHLNVVTLNSFDRSILRSGEDVWLENRLKKGEVPAHDLAIFTLTDLLLLAEADAFVVHFASNLSRLAYMLSLLHEKEEHLAAQGASGSDPSSVDHKYRPASLRGVFSPFVSVDGPWCYHWRMCCTISPHWPHSEVC